MTTETLGRFGHNPDPAIDFCIEVEEIENISSNLAKGLTGFGHEETYSGLAERIESALAFRVGGDEGAVAAKQRLRSLAPPVSVSISGWTYSIQYGPEGESDFSWVYDEKGEMVATMRTHNAQRIARPRSILGNIAASKEQAE